MGFKELNMQIHSVKLNACKCSTNKLVVDKFKISNKRDLHMTRNLVSLGGSCKNATDRDYF